MITAAVPAIDSLSLFRLMLTVSIVCETPGI
jgi:hypothetical protein